MTRTDYLAELDKYLQKLPKEDYQEAMDYYIEYFNEAGPEKEKEVIKELGSPKEAAQEILARLLDESLEQETDNSKHLGKIIWLTILSILAAPVTIPLVIALLSTIVVIIGTSVLFIFTLILLGLFLLANGIYMVFESFTYLSTSLASTSLSLGIGIIMASLSIITIIICIQVCSILIRICGRLVHKFLRKGRKA
ncbi:DUF1700 domain-containing protein [Streptococcus didelphis]|uniref:DUF1700 domain-containing protein n=1 Tax=Streptococcus didelphis TaxID=102886 RepID=A0ABY9LFE2_9STRE|nr:DUF1700 domain-containing protein [Streptococcus didelphis]WMB27653.1 DUF1700 domain-containing protein [Streptococcus didelphis]WMB29884.1 DUF1700 domain-containing protein [Streptococcus didelphis]